MDKSAMLTREAAQEGARHVPAPTRGWSLAHTGGPEFSVDDGPRLTAQRQATEQILAGAAARHGAGGLPYPPRSSIEALSGASIEDSPRLTAQRQAMEQIQAGAAARHDAGGLPHPLRSGIEALSGLSMDGVRVHYNSAEPAQLQALAFAQGSDIHLAPGQEHHLPHEAWHVVQQAQGRVRPTMQMKQGTAINDDASLEQEADEMGARALHMGSTQRVALRHAALAASSTAPRQRKVGFEFQMLASDVTLYNKNDEVEKLHWNNEQAWHIVRDGANIEFVTKPVDTPEQAKGVVEQISSVAAQVARKVEFKDNPSAANNKARRIKVNTPDTSGQPQVNVDVSLPKFIARTKGYTPNDARANAKYFGATGTFNWTQPQTEAMLGRGDAIRTAMGQFSDTRLLSYLYKATGNKYHVGNANAADRDRVLEALKAYCILQATILETAPANKGLTKDMPVLPKTDLNSLVALLKTRVANALVACNQIDAGKAAQVTIDPAFPDILPVLRASTKSGKTGDDLFEEENGSRHVYGVKAPKAVDRRNPNLLMEYRRVPILPVAGWVTFAQDAAQEFGTEDA